jgi:myotubularin-related protein 5/13
VSEEMSRGRVVEYVLVAGLALKRKHDSPAPPAEKDSEAGYTGTILQRFPTVDRKTTPLPRGIEIFCQPLGWTVTTSPSPPSLTTFILTAEDGKRLFCSSLTFYQLQSLTKRAKKRLRSVPVDQDVSSITESRQMTRFKSSPSFDCLDEAHEANWSPEAIVNNPHEIFQPLSLCLVSRLPLFDVLQSCLKGLYLTWLADSSPMEDIVAQLLTSFSLPPINCLQVKKPIGSVGEVVLPPIHEDSSLPYTSTGAFKLLQSIGVHNMIHLLSTLLSDISVLFMSSSFTALTSAVQCVCALLHPLKLSHSLVPVVPGDILEMVQLPSIYIMGLHTSLRSDVEDLGDVVELYLDDGRLITPASVSIPRLPPATLEPVHRALARVLNPRIDFRDHLFGTRTQPLKVKSLELQDKEVRAVFLCLLVSLLGDYQQFVTVLRFHPLPSFTFNKEGYLHSHSSEDSHSLLHKIVDGIPFMDFIHSRSVPYRKCDYFDELIARYSENPEAYGPEYLYSQQHIDDLAEELLHMLPPTAAKDDHFATKNLTPQEIAYPCKAFPHLMEKAVEQAMQLHSARGKKEGEGEEEENGDREDEMHDVPFLDISQTNADKNPSPTYQRDLESLRSCLDTLFQSKIIEARKYIPMVTQALKQRCLANSLVSELVHRVIQVNSVVLSSDQFDILVKLINSAVTDERSAMALLPVSTIMYREINPGIHQHICTHLQHHSIWTKLDFWKQALHSAVQAELVRIYAELELTNQNRSPLKSGRRVTTTCIEDRTEKNSKKRVKVTYILGSVTFIVGAVF